MSSDRHNTTILTSLNRGRLRNGNPSGDPSRSPRCGAKSKRTGLPCRAAGIKKAEGVYGRCQFHGGRSTGPKTAEGKAHASHQKHGYYSRSRIEQRQNSNALVRELRREVEALERMLARMNRTKKAEISSHDP